MRWNLVKMILRLVALLMTLLVTALIGNTIASNIEAAGTATAAVNFCMFAAIVAWISCIVGIASFFASALNKPVIQMPLDGIAVLFTLIAAIVISAKLQVVSCGSIDPKRMPNDWIVWGSDSDSKKCRTLQASCVFMWFLLTSLGGSLFLGIKDARDGPGIAASFRGSNPPMSQLSV